MKRLLLIILVFIGMTSWTMAQDHHRAEHHPIHKPVHHHHRPVHHKPVHHPVHHADHR